MPAHQLDDTLIEVASIAQKAARNVVCVSQTLEDSIVCNRDLTSLPELLLTGLVGKVSVLNPAVVGACIPLGDMLLEDDHVGVRDLLCVRRGDDRSSIVMDGVDEDWRTCRQQWKER